MIEQLRNYKESFTLHKSKYITWMVVCLTIVAITVLSPVIITAELGQYFAKMSKSVEGVYVYLQNSQKSLNLFVDEIKILLLCFGLVIFVANNVNMVLCEKEMYIAKINLGYERYATIVEILTKSLITNLISVVLGAGVGIATCFLYKYLNKCPIAICVSDIITVSVVTILLSLIASYLTFLFAIDRAREIKDVK